MADGAYRWLGNAPAPDAARVDGIHAALDQTAAHAFGEPARAAAVERIDRTLTTARADGLEAAVAALSQLRSRIEALRPDALEPRRGLAGLFDSRGKRLNRFREQFRDAADRLTDSGAALAVRIEGAARRATSLDAVWAEIRDAVADLDAHLAAAARALSGHAPAPAATEDGAVHPLEARKATLDACRAAALQSLPLIRGSQNADARTSEALKSCTDGLAAWRDDWRDALGLSGKRPRRIRPDKARLARSREQALARLDRTLAELTTLGARRGDVERRLAAVAAGVRP
ncbi:MAG TPA: toxic anion resistance protein [Brevundimonas sp.]